MDSKQPQVLAFTPRVKNVIQRVLNQGGFSVHENAHFRGKSSLDASGSGGYAGYIGAFAIMTETVNNGYIIRVVDYQTYNPQTGTSNKMLCRVNGVSYDISPWKSNVLTQDVYVWLSYEAETKKIAFVLTNTIMVHDTDEYAYYYLGAVSYANGKTTISQQHLTGTAIFWHGFTC